MQAVKEQYERFPYPPVSALALPRRDQGQGLRYECAVELAGAAGLAAIEPAHHQGLRILVAGAGTLEPLVVAQQHRQAREIVAVDLSRRSLDRLRRRTLFGRVRAVLNLHWLPPIKRVEADIREWNDGDFDYIIASNVLHHTDDPAETLHHLAAMLKPGGVLRIVTYPRQSRFWINRTSEWLRWHGLSAATPRLRQRVRKVIKLLPADHPIRSCFNAHSETATTAGLVDAFFHSCDNPLSPLQWQQATESAGLEWLGETQAELAQGKLLLALAPESAALTAWQRLQIMDDLLELNTSPILWFCKRARDGGAAAATPALAAVKGAPVDITKARWSLPSQIYWQLGQGLRRADALLHSVGSGLLPLVARLREEVGPRLDRKNRLLPGLTIGEYPVESLLAATEPPHLEQWQQLEESAGRCRIEYWNGDAIPGVTLGAQEQWLQLRYGYKHGWIGPLATKLHVEP
jgi:SAM-dependent methyltransferase